jgi:hypothetical protein
MNNFAAYKITLSCLCFSLFAGALQASVNGRYVLRDRISFDTPKPDHVTLLKVDYDIECQGTQRLVAGRVRVGPHNIQFNMARGTQSTEMIVAQGGRANSSRPAKLQAAVSSLETSDSASCKLRENSIKLSTRTEKVILRPKLDMSAAEMDRLALAHAPYVVMREDLHPKDFIDAGNPFDDVPLVVGYALIPRNENIVSGVRRSRRVLGQRFAGFNLRYTLVFSDQDADKRSVDAVNKQIARWSRRADIEWVYEVQFDLQGRVVNRRYLEHKIGTENLPVPAFLQTDKITIQLASDFRGSFMNSNSASPIIYVANTHNAFSGKARGKQKSRNIFGYHFVPSTRVESPLPREEIMFQNPWTFMVSDLEVLDRGVMDGYSDDMLYVRITGEHRKGEFTPNIRTLGHVFSVGNGAGSMAHLGRDLWDKSSYATIRISRDLISRIVSGELCAEFKHTLRGQKADMDIENLEFFRLQRSKDEQTYRVENVSDKFSVKGEFAQSIGCSTNPMSILSLEEQDRIIADRLIENFRRFGINEF